MTSETLLALCIFAFVASITPGPNNLMLMASGANFGFRRTVPHMLGVGLGFVLMVILVGLGVVGVFQTYPAAYQGLKLISVLYLGYLAWKIANASRPEEADTTAKPLSFLQAAAFQWVNPKAWAMALTAVTIYAPSQEFSAILPVALVFGAINLPSVSSWTYLGQQMQRILNKPSRLTAFNWTMAALLLLSMVPLLSADAGW